MAYPALSDVNTWSISNFSFIGISLVSFVSANAFSVCIFSALFYRLHCRYTHNHTRTADAPRYEIWVSLCWNVFQLLLLFLLLLLAKQDAQAAAGLALALALSLFLGLGLGLACRETSDTRCFSGLAWRRCLCLKASSAWLGLVRYSSVWVSV